MARIALLCSGLGTIRRGHEIFARDLYTLLSDDIDITLFKGAGPLAAREIVVPHVSRLSPALDSIHLPVSPKWHAAAVEVERMRVEGETFAWGALGSLLDGDYDVIHCLEQEVCNVLYAHRHLFAKTPKFLWSNGGAIPGARQPNCDYVQEHTEFNLSKSRGRNAFVIPHGVDLALFDPRVHSDFRAQHGIPADAFVVLSVGTICYWHKRMDHVIREIARLSDVYLVIVGQECEDTSAIKEMGQQLMQNRIVFASVPHEQLPAIYAAADVFVLGSLFEAFGIVYIEAMAMELPVVCTHHPNQRSIVKEGVFVDMSQTGELTAALRDTPRERLRELGLRGRQLVREHYDLAVLRRQYIDHYTDIAAASVHLPRYGLADKVRSNLRNVLKRT